MPTTSGFAAGVKLRRLVSVESQSGRKQGREKTSSKSRHGSGLGRGDQFPQGHPEQDEDRLGAGSSESVLRPSTARPIKKFPSMERRQGQGKPHYPVEAPTIVPHGPGLGEIH